MTAPLAVQRPLRSVLESMTGFGRGAASTDGLDVTTEVRSVNGRYVEVSVRTPRELAPHEVEIQNRCRSALSRGKVSVSVQMERRPGEAPVALDEPLARAYGELLERLRFLTGTQQPVQLEHLLQFRDVLVTERTAEAAPELVWQAASEALDIALEACVAMRRQEGAALAADLRARLAAIEDETAAIERDAPERLVAARDALRARLADLLDGETRVDPARLDMEIALLADRLDVNEECVRLRSHLAQCREALELDEPVGRRLNFLSQELNREINTIASKANDAAMAQRAVRMKEELEKLREQIQNVA